MFFMEISLVNSNNVATEVVKEFVDISKQRDNGLNLKLK